MSSNMIMIGLISLLIIALVSSIAYVIWLEYFKTYPLCSEVTEEGIGVRCINEEGKRISMAQITLNYSNWSQTTTGC